VKSLLAAFPDEEKAINKYFELIEETRQSMRGFVGLKFMPTWLGSFLVATGLVSFYTDYFEKAQKSVTQVIQSITHNAALRAVLSYNFGDYGTIPKDAPFGMHAALQNHMLRGVSFPVGGSSNIGFTIVPTILKAGGAVYVRAEVESIVTDESGRVATGVKMKKDGAVISAPIIISDAGLFNTATRLLSPAAAPRLDPMMRHVRHGTGGLSVYVGLKGTAAELGLEGKHYWAAWTKPGQEDLDAITEQYVNRSQKDLAAGPVPLLFISFPSAKDPLWDQKHPGKATATIVTFANYEWFREFEDGRVMHRGEKYEELKKALGDLIWKQTLALFPQLKDKVEYFDVGTPVTNRYYLAAQGGEMYGADHNVARFSPQATIDLRPQTAIKNLYLTGQDIFNCGFAGASFGGLFCASAVLQRNLYEELHALKNKSRPSIPK
jgi:all-trans-retinol 13,14-reductase